MLTYLVTDHKKFNEVEDIEIKSWSDIWGGEFNGEIIVYTNDYIDHYAYSTYSIKHFIQKYGFIISEE